MTADTYTPWILMALSAVVVPSVGWLISSAVSLDKRFTAHEQVDAAIFEQLHTTLVDLKNEQKDQTTKLDRLVERLPVPRGRSL